MGFSSPSVHFSTTVGVSLLNNLVVREYPILFRRKHVHAHDSCLLSLALILFKCEEG